jgi:CelD/BcsL family acetyltransferase involved in cellulose biosynthesis
MSIPTAGIVSSPIVNVVKVPQKHYRVALPDLPSDSFWTTVVTSADELEQLAEPWRRLSQTAIRPNAFLDYDFLSPAFRHLDSGDVQVVVVWAKQKSNANKPPVICALLPIQKRRFYGLPLRCFEVWKHDQCFDCTPLVRSDCAAAVWAYLLNWMSEELGAQLFSLDTVAGDGDWSNLLTDEIHQSSRGIFMRDQFTRACFEPMDDAQTYLNTKVAKNTRKGTLRLRRKLSAIGDVQTEHFGGDQSPAGYHTLTQQFVELEMAGWKGKAETAFGSDPRSEAFFLEMCGRMLVEGKLTIARTTLDGKPIAIACDLLCGDRGAHFKTTFDESLQQFSPGVILEIDSLEHLHHQGITRVDSCADPNHSMINRIWPDRTRFQSLVVSLRGPMSHFAVSTLPTLQWASKSLGKK